MRTKILRVAEGKQSTLSQLYIDDVFQCCFYYLGVPLCIFANTQQPTQKNASGSGYPLQSFVRSSQKDFRFYPSRKKRKVYFSLSTNILFRCLALSSKVEYLITSV